MLHHGTTGPKTAHSHYHLHDCRRPLFDAICARIYQSQQGQGLLYRVEGAGGGIRFELYDLKTDPFEKTNVAAKCPERVSELKSALRRWLESVVGSYNGDDYLDGGRNKRD